MNYSNISNTHKLWEKGKGVMNGEISVNVVRKDGIIDREATISLFLETLDDLIENESALAGNLEHAIVNCFSRFPAGMNLPALVALVQVEIEPNDIGKWEKIAEATKSFVANDPRFLVKRGKGGGVFFNS